MYKKSFTNSIQLLETSLKVCFCLFLLLETLLFTEFFSESIIILFENIFCPGFIN